LWNYAFLFFVSAARGSIEEEATGLLERDVEVWVGEGVQTFRHVHARSGGDGPQRCQYSSGMCNMVVMTLSCSLVGDTQIMFFYSKLNFFCCNAFPISTDNFHVLKELLTNKRQTSMSPNRF